MGSFRDKSATYQHCPERGIAISGVSRQGVFDHQVHYLYNALWLAATRVLKTCNTHCTIASIKNESDENMIKPTDIATSVITQASHLAHVTSGFPAVVMGGHLLFDSKAPLRRFGKLECLISSEC